MTERGAPHRETAQAPLCRFGRGPWEVLFWVLTHRPLAQRPAGQVRRGAVGGATATSGGRRTEGGAEGRLAKRRRAAGGVARALRGRRRARRGGRREKRQRAPADGREGEERGSVAGGSRWCVGVNARRRWPEEEEAEEEVAGERGLHAVSRSTRDAQQNGAAPPRSVAERRLPPRPATDVLDGHIRVGALPPFPVAECAFLLAWPPPPTSSMVTSGSEPSLLARSMSAASLLARSTSAASLLARSTSAASLLARPPRAASLLARPPRAAPPLARPPRAASLLSWPPQATRPRLAVACLSAHRPPLRRRSPFLNLGKSHRCLLSHQEAWCTSTPEYILWSGPTEFTRYSKHDASRLAAAVEHDVIVALSRQSSMSPKPLAVAPALVGFEGCLTERRKKNGD
ncbi:hypothetical protein DAI22_01g088508 [Oryza sativa Japonica Group]|nr:hypothetical protein DAI22_01g088508 [Oryza sativa Japonica Group]